MNKNLFLIVVFLLLGCESSLDRGPVLRYSGLSKPVSLREMRGGLNDYFGERVLLYGVLSSTHGLDLYPDDVSFKSLDTASSVLIHVQNVEFCDAADGDWVLVYGWIVKSNPNYIHKYAAEIIGVEAVYRLSNEQLNDCRNGKPLDEVFSRR